MIRKFLPLLVVAVVAAAILVGCSRRGAEQNGKVTLTLVSWGNEREEKSLRSLIQSFEKAHPNIRVELLVSPHVRVFDKLMILTAGERPPDVSRISSLWFHAAASKKLFEDLAPYVQSDKSFDIKDFYPESIDGWGKYQGVLYAIPTDIDVYAMYYNKTMFDKYHIPYPDWSWDWAKYMEVAKKLTKDTNGDGKRDQWGASIDQFWQSYIYQNGGSIVSGDQKRCTLTDPAAYEAIQWMADLSNNYHIAPSAEESTGTLPSKLFTNGQIGMFVAGSWAAELWFKDKITDFTYDIAPIPKNKERATFIGGGGYAMFRGSKHKKEAWELLKWMTGPEYQRKAALDSGIIPSRRSVAESGAYLKQSAPPQHKKVFLDMIEYGKPTPPVSVWPEMNEMINAEVSLALLGKESAKDACYKVTPFIDQLLRHQE